MPRNAGSPLARASEPPAGESRATSTTRRPETSESAAKLDLLDKLFGVAVRRFWSELATIPHCGHARNGGALAQGRIPFVREADLQGQEAGRETTDVEGGSGIDLPIGR